MRAGDGHDGVVAAQGGDGRGHGEDDGGADQNGDGSDGQFFALELGGEGVNGGVGGDDVVDAETGPDGADAPVLGGGQQLAVADTAVVVERSGDEGGQVGVGAGVDGVGLGGVAIDGEGDGGALAGAG